MIQTKYSAIAILLGITFHFLTTVKIAGSSLRVGTSDLVLPFAVAFVFFEMYRQGRGLMNWRVPFFLEWLAALSVWLAFSVLVGRFYSGGWETWAFFNKFIGWFILVLYLLLGICVSCFGGERGKQQFLKVFLTTGWMVCAYEIIMYSLYLHGVIGNEDEYVRIRGFFDNPNAFGIALAIMIVLHAPFLSKKQLFAPWVGRIGFALTVLAFLLAGSRSAYLGLICSIPVLLVLKVLNLSEVLKGIALAMFLGVVVIFLPAKISEFSHIWESSGGIEFNQTLEEPDPDPDPDPTSLYILRSDQLEDSGINHRLELSKRAADLWKESPVIGIGLGSFFWEEKRNGRFMVIHNTLLWLLTETGLIGAMLFSGFFIVCAKALIWPWQGKNHDPFLVAGFSMLVVCFGASMGTEVMSQRYVWFLLGCALGIPRVMSGKREEDRTINLQKFLNN